MAFDKKAYNHKWHVENRDKNAERHRKWRAKNPGKDRIYNKRWYHKNKEEALNLSREWRLKHEFGLSLLDYEAMLIKQSGLCAICLNPEVKRRLAVDHCHQTGRIRGLLCLSCNRGIGLFKDDSEKLVRAATYLKEPYEKSN